MSTLEKSRRLTIFKNQLEEIIHVSNSPQGVWYIECFMSNSAVIAPRTRNLFYIPFSEIIDYHLYVN